MHVCWRASWGTQRYINIVPLLGGTFGSDPRSSEIMS